MSVTNIDETPLSQDDKNELLLSILRKLTTVGFSETDADHVVTQLKSVYCDNFRHQYSILTGYMLQIEKQDKDTLQTLSDNLDLYAETFLEADTENLEYTKGVTKLIDHLSLEKVRLFRVIDLYSPLQREADRMKAEISSSQAALDTTVKSVENIKIDLVAMLGVFSGIILAFMGGISFTNEMIQGIGAISIHRLIVVAAVCGLVLIDTLMIIMQYVSRIVFRNGNNQSYFTWALLIVNVVFLAIIVATSVLYFKEHNISLI